MQDPYPPSPQVQPAPGNRLLSIKYEAVSQSAVSQNLSELPAPELLDSTGTSYRSEHGRLSMVGGARTPGEFPPGKRMEASALFEIPASATGLRVAFRAPAGPDAQGVMVTLD
ncbi:MAG: hypothetical protein ACR2KK_21680 [Acidimicrobiales bacterium]